jgi:uncharacterized membrane protein
VIKAISWRVIATMTTMILVYIFTKELFVSISVGVFEVMAKITFYYIHERIWQKADWGKEKHPLADIPVTRELKPEGRDKIEQQLQNLGYMD